MYEVGNKKQGFQPNTHGKGSQRAIFLLDYIREEDTKLIVKKLFEMAINDKHLGAYKLLLDHIPIRCSPEQAEKDTKEIFRNIIINSKDNEDMFNYIKRTFKEIIDTDTNVDEMVEIIFNKFRSSNGFKRKKN